MTFISLNNLRVPIIEGSVEMSYIDIGDRTRAFDGTLITTRRALKRRWVMTTQRLTAEDANTLSAMVHGRGFRFTYNSTAYSDKGVGPSTATNITYLPSLGVDGRPVASDVRYGSASVVINPARTNVSPIKDTSGTSASWTPTNAIVSDVGVSEAYTGTGCIRVDDTTTAQASIALTAPSTPASGNYTVSAYVRGNVPVQLQLQGSTTGLGTAVQSVTSLTEWVRIQGATLTGVTGAETVNIIFSEVQSPFVTGNHFFIDAIQLEKTNSTADYAGPSSFTLTSNSAAELAYVGRDFFPPAANLDGITIAFWSISQPISSSGRFVTLGNGVDLNNEIYAAPSNLGIIFSTRDSSGIADQLIASGTMRPDRLSLVVCTLRRSDYSKRIYVDGALVTSSTLTASSFPNLDDITALHVGSTGSATLKTALPIDDLMVLPYVMSQAQIAALHTGSLEIPAFPRLLMTGSIIQEPSLTVEGTVDSVEYLSGFAPYSYFQNNLQQLRLVLEEV